MGILVHLFSIMYLNSLITDHYFTNTCNMSEEMCMCILLLDHQGLHILVHDVMFC